MKICRVCILYFLGVLFLIQSCRDQFGYEQDKVVTQTIDSVMNFMSIDLDPHKNYKLIHFERYPDKTKSFSVEQNILRNQQGDYKAVVEELVKHLKDSVTYRFKDYKYKNITISESDEFDDSDFFYDPDFYGLISISNSTNDGEFGCYYLAIECGEDCGQGILVRVKLQNEIWRVDRISSLWTAN